MKKIILTICLLIILTGCTKQEVDQNEDSSFDNGQEEIIMKETDKEIKVTSDESKEDLNKSPVILDELESGSLIESPLVIKGEALGTWFFEGDFLVKLVNDKNEIIAESYATAKGDWMTEDHVFFEAKLEFDSRNSKTGTLIFEKDNPSGRAENIDSFEVTVKFK